MSIAEEGLSIQEAAAETGLSAHTLRYYERIGLMPAASRAASGHRRYGVSDLEWVVLLKRLRTTGMPIAEMQHFAALVRQGETTIGARRALLEAHEQKLRAQLRDVTLTLDVLEHKITTYRALEAASRQGEAT